MDGMKVFANKEKEMENLIQRIRIYSQEFGSQDIPMEFGIEKFAIKIGKRETAGGIKLPNQKSIRTLGNKEKYKNIGILIGWLVFMAYQLL